MIEDDEEGVAAEMFEVEEVEAMGFEEDEAFRDSRICFALFAYSQVKDL